jgi:hypothetical protein
VLHGRIYANSQGAGLALAEKGPLSGVVFIADACEEDPAELYQLAGEARRERRPAVHVPRLGRADTDKVEAAGPLFDRMAELSRGAYCPFGPGSAEVLRELLSTVAAFSAGGVEAVKQGAETRTIRQG